MLDIKFPRRVAVQGRMCAGKDVIATALKSVFGHQRVAFGDFVKQEVAEKHGITVEELDRRKGEFRSDLQQHGHGQRQKHGEDYWVKKLVEYVDSLPPDSCLVLPDCRYANEAEELLRGDWFILQVRVPEYERIRRITELYGPPTDEQLSHPSEIAIHGLPHHAMVSGSLSTLGLNLQARILDLNAQWGAMGRPVFKDITC